jgi:maltose alpha-D-glucosyltransferase/alpha-amylase
MGDNVYLGDRNGVRTPMQWSADKNAGFSRANPQRLVLPVIIDPDYHYESVNVEAQQRSPGSLLWWTKRLLALRKRHAAFGRGSLEQLRPENPKILAFVRRHEDEVLLVVANLSRFVEFVELDLSPWKGTVPVELFGRSALPPVGDAPYPLTLAGHGFYWFSLSPKARDEARADAYEPPALQDWAWPPAPGTEHDAALAEVLEGWAAAQAWFAGRKRRVEGTRVVEAVAVGEAWLYVLELTYEDGGTERYLTAPAAAEGARAAEIRARSPQAVVASLPGTILAGEPGSADRTPISIPSGAVLFDALADPPSTRTLLETVFARGRIEGRGGVVKAGPVSTLPERFFSDMTRRLDTAQAGGPPGPSDASPGLALDRFLAAQRAEVRVPPLAGAVEYVSSWRTGEAGTFALVVLHAYVPSETDAFAHTVSEVHRFFERVLARGGEEPAPPPAAWDAVRLASAGPPAVVRDAVGAFLDTARLLGRRTAELHDALAGSGGTNSLPPDFVPEPYSPLDQRGVYQTMRNLAGRCLRELGSRARFLPPQVAPLAARVVARHDEVLRRLGALLGRKLTALRTRHPGGLDLRQVLLTGNDVLFADLGGDRARPAAERLRKGSPLRDVAGLVRSLHEATFSALLDPARVRPEDVEAARPWAHAFWEASTAALLHGYLEAAGPRLLPKTDARGELGVLLDAFVLEGAFGGLASALAAADPRRQAVALELLLALLEGDNRPGGLEASREAP